MTFVCLNFSQRLGSQRSVSAGTGEGVIAEDHFLKINPSFIEMANLVRRTPEQRVVYTLLGSAGVDHRSISLEILCGYQIWSEESVTRTYMNY